MGSSYYIHQHEEFEDLTLIAVKEGGKKGSKGFLHDSRSNSINTNAIRRLLLREAARKRSDCTFCRGVVEQRGVRHVCRDRSAVYDAIAALHVLEGVFGHCEHGNDVGLECLFRHV